jgi:hypothetical protein
MNVLRIEYLKIPVCFPMNIAGVLISFMAILTIIDVESKYKWIKIIP